MIERTESEALRPFALTVPSNSSSPRAFRVSRSAARLPRFRVFSKRGAGVENTKG